MSELCYIRRAGQPWVQGKDHHSIALAHYRNMEGEPGEKCRITVPHSLGGSFVAYFSKINEKVYQYIDEYNNEVSIMMCTPEWAGYINRITDC
jgi:hypothetical protein